MNTYKTNIRLGDPSNDGHGKTQTVILESNYSKDELFGAYVKSCQKTGMSLNDTPDYTGLGRPYSISSDYQVATEYEGNKLTPECRSILTTYGIDVSTINYVYIDEFIYILIEFIKLSLPSDAIITRVEDDVPEFDVWLGYGLFS